VKEVKMRPKTQTTKPPKAYNNRWHHHHHHEAMADTIANNTA